MLCYVNGFFMIFLCEIVQRGVLRSWFFIGFYVRLCFFHAFLGEIDGFFHCCLCEICAMWCATDSVCFMHVR